MLEDLADLSRTFQEALTHLAQTGDVWPMGAAEAAGGVDVRLILARTEGLTPDTARRFPAEVEDRLKERLLRIPPLRERRPDILLLLHHFLRTVPARARPTLTPEAEQLLLDHRWPGNVRELQVVATRLAGRPTITARDVEAHLHIA